MHLRLTIILLLTAFLMPKGAWAGGAGDTAGLETYTFEREIHLAPGEFYAVSYDNEQKEFIETEPDRNYGCLPDRAIKHVLRAPMWLREKFADRLVDLYYDDIDVGEDAAPVFFDVDGDGLRDLVCGNADGELKCYIAPYFRQDNEILGHIKVQGNATPIFQDKNDDGIEELVVVSSNGTFSIWGGDGWKENITGIPKEKILEGLNLNTARLPMGEYNFWVRRREGKIDALWEGPFVITSAIPVPSNYSQLIKNIERIEVPGDSLPVFEDVTSDGFADLLIGSSDGTICVYKNYGTNDDPWFVSNRAETDRKFGDDIGYLSSPCIHDVNGDDIEDIVTGGKDLNALKVFYGPEYTETGTFTYDPSYAEYFNGAIVPALCDFNRDGTCDQAIGMEDGNIYIFTGQQSNTAAFDDDLSRGLNVPGPAAPCAGYFDGDDICDLVVGAGDGRLYFFRGLREGFERIDDVFEGLEVGEYPTPTGYDYNRDGLLDLVVGNRAGEIKVFLAPDWVEVEGGLGLVDMGDYSSPAFGDLNRDGVPELLIGSLDGTFRYFEGRGSQWAEKYSWQFHPTYGIAEIGDFFTRTHPDATLFRGANDDETLSNYLDVLDNCGDEYLDEVVFAMANTQTEILRVMSCLGNADIVFENARAIYDFASKVKYAGIKEKEDYTTIEYISEDGTPKEMPRDIYYWWVVHPVCEFEIPARVDASYWRHDADYYGITGEQWTRKEITAENYEHTPNAYFWRTFLPVDRRYGKNLLDVVGDAENIKEAAYLIADYITFAGSKPGIWNEYGKASNDLQPLVIYEKNYGSCGEQAMLGVAYSRAALIPNAPVGCHGEDHAWNEWWMDGNWYKWDVGNAITEMGHPWYEGRGHTGTPRLTIARRRGDGVAENTTTLPVNPPGSNFIPGNAPGYSEVGKVHMRVVDETGEPVEGALLIVRSKWNNYYRTSIWDYTDPDGYCYFELGNPVTGSCVVDVITPLGVTGTEYFVVRENEEFEYTYTLPGKFKAKKMKMTRKKYPGINDIDISVSVIEEEQRPANYSGSRKNRSRDGMLLETTGFYGTRWYSEPNLKQYGVYSAKLTAEQYEEFLITNELPEATWVKDDHYSEVFTPGVGEVFAFYNANRFTHVRFKASLSPAVQAEKPEIVLVPSQGGVNTGDKAVFRGSASDNLYVAALEVSFNGGIDFEDITGSYDRESKAFEYTWDTGAGGPVTPGDYDIVFRVEDGSGLYSETEPVIFPVFVARDFTGQVIYQDDPDSPLPACSWVLGPFTVSETERFLGIDARSDEIEFDMDLFLFHDKNGNRKLDGMQEQIASSTSPTAIETLLLNDPQPGAYWIYCQGWKVPERTDIEPWVDMKSLPPGRLLSLPSVDVRKKTAYASIDISLSFNCSPAFIADINPSNRLLTADPVITGGFSDGFNIDTDSFAVKLDGEDIPERAVVDDAGFSISLDGLPIQIGDEYTVTIQAMTTNGLTDKVELTLAAAEPETVIISHTIDAENETMTVDVGIIDEGDRLGSVRAMIDEQPWIDLAIDDAGVAAEGAFSLEGTEKGDYTLTVEYLITGLETKSKEISFNYSGKKQTSLLKILPGDGAKVFDHRSVLVVYYSLEIRDDVEGVKIFLDGEDITDAAYVYDDGVIYLPDGLYSKGEHIFEVAVTLTDGSIVESKSTFNIMSMDDVEEEQK